MSYKGAWASFFHTSAVHQLSAKAPRILIVNPNTQVDPTRTSKVPKILALSQTKGRIGFDFGYFAGPSIDLLWPKEFACLPLGVHGPLRSPEFRRRGVSAPHSRKARHQSAVAASCPQHPTYLQNEVVGFQNPVW